MEISLKGLQEYILQAMGPKLKVRRNKNRISIVSK
jgi:hypothetical protein